MRLHRPSRSVHPTTIINDERDDMMKCAICKMKCEFCHQPGRVDNDMFIHCVNESYVCPHPVGHPVPALLADGNSDCDCDDCNAYWRNREGYFGAAEDIYNSDDDEPRITVMLSEPDVTIWLPDTATTTTEDV